MKTVLYIAFGVFFTFCRAAHADLFDGANAHEMKRIAYSSKLGVEVFAETTDGKWCDDIVSLKLFAHDETAFDEALLSKLMEKVGRVLENECPSVKQAALDGYNNNTLVYQGGASKPDKWKPEKGALKVQIRQLQAAAAKTGKAPDWIPPAGKKILARVDPSALEHRVYSKDKKCSVFLTTDKPANIIKKWSIIVGDNSCSENLVYGRANVTLFNERGKYAGTADGYFTEGRFTGRKNLNVVLLNRYGYGKNSQNLSYLIESDPELKIHYVGYLNSRRNPKTGRYSVWNGCSPFTIAAVTDNEELFLDSAVTDNIIRTAQSYADIFCPGVKKMKFFATRVPQGLPGMDMPETKDTDLSEDTRLIYSAVMQRGKDKKWKFVSDTAQNLARLREMKRRAEETREHQLMMADYNELTRSDYLGRLAYMHGVERIDNPVSMLLASQIIQAPVPINSLVRIASLGKDSAWTDWPAVIKITGTSGLLNRSGWHIVSGALSPLNKEERKAQNVPDADFAGTLELSAATACEEDGCREISDVVSLVRKRHDKPSWTPYHAPQRTDGE